MAYQIVIKAKSGELLLGGVNQVSSKQETITSALDYVSAMLDRQEKAVDSVKIINLDTRGGSDPKNAL